MYVSRIQIYEWFRLEIPGNEKSFYWITNLTLWTDSTYTVPCNITSITVNENDFSLQIEQYTPVNKADITIQITLNHKFDVTLNSSFVLEVCGYHEINPNHEPIVVEFDNNTQNLNYDYSDWFMSNESNCPIDHYFVTLDYTGKEPESLEDIYYPVWFKFDNP